MAMKVFTGTALVFAVAFFFASLCVFLDKNDIHPLRRLLAFFKELGILGNLAILPLAFSLVVYAIDKGPSGGGDGGGDGGTNNIQMVVGPGSGLQQLGSPGSVTNMLGHGVAGEIPPMPGGVLGDPAPVVDEWTNFTPITSTNTTRTLAGDDFRRGVVMTRIGTDEEFDFEPPSNATIVSDWRGHGAATDWFYAAFTNWAFRVATNDVDSLRVYAFGKIQPLIRAADNTVTANYWFVPFRTTLGIVPESNWDWLEASDAPSQVWFAITPENTLLITYQNVLLDRDTGKPLSFQVEFKTSVQFTYRYDFSRCGALGDRALPDGGVASLLVGVSFAGNEWTTNSLPTNVTSMAFYPLLPEDACDEDPDNDGIATIDELFVHHTDPRNADTDYDGLSDGEEILFHGTDPLDPESMGAGYGDGFAAKLGGLDPFSCPVGSTNTVLEHIFYSGTTNGVFAYPTSTVETAVLHVSVSGSGTGRLVVGDAVVPLVAPPQLRSGTVTNTLLLVVGRGVRKEVWLTKPDGLDVSLRSDELLIGRFPNTVWPHGWIAFPHTDATLPCIHDLASCGKTVSLVHGEEFPGLTATWESESQGVAITNVPPVSAKIYGRFPKTQTRLISYTISHPDYQCGQTNFTQTLRFCPQLTEPEEEGLDDPPDEEEGPYYSCECGTGGTCSCCTGEWCHCTCWDCPCNQNQPPALGDSDEESEEAYTNIVSGALQPLANALYLYRANTQTEHLDVPDGNPVECCPCPDHCRSNYVAKAFCSRRLSVSNGGEEFRITHDPCDVTISGVSPSRAFSDASLLFVTNGATYKRRDYTVLGVKFESMYGRASLSNYNHRSSSLGYPVAICTNISNAGSIVLRTDVLLPDGVVRLSMEDASGDIALWLPEWADSHGAWHPAERLLNAGGVTTRYMTISRWRNVMRRYPLDNAIEAKVVSSRTSSCKVKLEFVALNGDKYVHDYAEQRITTVMPVFFPDFNRDMRANISDALDQGNGRNLYFWSNHDTWRGDDAFAAYDGYIGLVHPWPITLPANNGDMIVNGRNDLVNVCPFAVNLSQLGHEWGSDSVRVVFYTSDPGNVRFTPVRTNWSALDAIVREDQKTFSGESLHSAELSTTTFEGLCETGYELPSEFFSLGGLESGILAVEFAAEGEKILRVVVEDRASGEVLFESQVVVRVLDVHDMYRWLNLEYACNETTAPKYNNRLSVLWPDSEHADVNVVFVHGYNVHPSEAWDWSQAMFKRLWWSGMDAGFTAVLWRGNESQLWIPPAKCYATINYHQNVLNAFLSADEFASDVNSLPGAKKYMIAHSLGNMLVSAARQFHELQYEKYLMLNAAVPIEAYDQESGVTEDSKFCMTPPDWRPYPDRVRSTHWYELFLSLQNDERRRLTWKGIFKDVCNTVNFYSSKDEVVANGNGKWKWPIKRNYAWYNQERARGAYLVSMSPQAGWKFSEHYLTNSIVENPFGGFSFETRLYTPAETALISNDELREHSFFKELRDTAIYGSGGGQFLASNPYVLWYALSHGIPAESFATGANPVPKWGAAAQGNIMNNKNFKGGLVRNIDMAVNCVPDGRKELPWIHSYYIKNSLFDTAVLYKALVNQIGSTIPDNPEKENDNE